MRTTLMGREAPKDGDLRQCTELLCEQDQIPSFTHDYQMRFPSIVAKHLAPTRYRVDGAKGLLL
jgi:hypothetical protein